MICLVHVACSDHVEYLLLARLEPRDLLQAVHGAGGGAGPGALCRVPPQEVALLPPR